jgi:hypothetical protein
MGALKQHHIKNGTDTWNQEPEDIDFDSPPSAEETAATIMPHITPGMTKAQIGQAACSLVDTLLENGNVLLAAEGLSAMEAFAKEVKADPRFTEYVREELAKTGGKYTTTSGAKVEIKETGVSYDYTSNPQWVELNDQVKAAEEKRKALEERLKKIPAGKMLVDEETGETLIGPAKSSKSSYAVTLAK